MPRLPVFLWIPHGRRGYFFRGWELMEGASAAFGDARCAHFALEEIYADAMDYSALESFCAALIPRIFENEVY